MKKEIPVSFSNFKYKEIPVIFKEEGLGFTISFNNAEHMSCFERIRLFSKAIQILSRKIQEEEHIN